MTTNDRIARRYHDRLPGHVRNYLRIERGLSDDVIDRHLLGWNGRRITIPVLDRQLQVSFFKFAQHPSEKGSGPKMYASSGARAELYGWDTVLQPLDTTIIICEGEFDRLVLETHGFPAVTSTAGALTFRAEWARALRAFPNVFICFDRDTVGEAGARRVASFLPDARIVALPPTVGASGDVADYFVRCEGSAAGFQALLDAAEPLPEADRVSALPVAREQRVSSRTNAASALKASIRIEDWIAQYLVLTVQGQNLVAHCPFHDDHTPSFVVFRATQTFYCFGCRAHGDVFTFLMRMRGIGFQEACKVVHDAIARDGEDIA